MSTPAIAPVMGVTQQAVHRTQQRIADAQVTTRVVTSPDPLAEEKADGRVVKLTGPGSLLHSEPAPRTMQNGPTPKDRPAHR